MKTRTGYIIRPKRGTKPKDKRWVARVTYTNAAGERKDVTKWCRTITDAKVALQNLLNRIEKDVDRSVDASKITFEKAAEAFIKAKLFKAEYRDGVKVAGVRSMNVLGYVPILLEHFGRRKLKSVTAWRPRGVQA